MGAPLRNANDFTLIHSIITYDSDVVSYLLNDDLFVVNRSVIITIKLLGFGLKIIGGVVHQSLPFSFIATPTLRMCLYGACDEVQ